MDKIDELLTRGVANIYPNKEVLEKVLRSGKKLRLYQGFDPSMPSLHLGNWVGIQKLRQFQELGHEVIFLIGDFTGMIGDPTDKSATRQMLTLEQTQKNAETWKEQAGKILKFDGDNPVKILSNSTWNNKVNFKDVIGITANFTVQQMMERDFFQMRLQAGKPIYLHEFLYPVVQAYDNVAMDVDMEIGGNDQTFNMLAGRTLMAAMSGKEKYVLTTKLLVDNQGNKHGKTTGNPLFLSSTPNDLFGGIMSFPDEVISLSFELLTMVPQEKLDEVKKRLEEGENPISLKKELAHQIVLELHGKVNADIAQVNFEKTVQKDEVPENMEEKVISNKVIGIADLIMECKLTSSKSEAKRLIEQGGVELDGKKIMDNNTDIELKDGMVLKVGKRKFIKLKI